MSKQIKTFVPQGTFKFTFERQPKFAVLHINFKTIDNKNDVKKLGLIINAGKEKKEKHETNVFLIKMKI